MLKPNVEFNKQLVDKIKALIRNKLSPRHVPNIILQISQIPVGFFNYYKVFKVIG